MASDLPDPLVSLLYASEDARERRAEFVAGLRALADFFEAHPDAPVYLFRDSAGVKRELVEVGVHVHVHDQVEFEAFKRRFGIDGDDAVTDGGFVHAVRHFGPYVTYGVQRSTR